MGALALQRVGWQHPEAAAAGLAGGAWAIVLAPLVGGEHVRALHLQAHQDLPLGAAAAGWLLMVTAMMVPTALPAVRHLALRALWRRRRRTVVLFLGGYVGTWGVFGVVALPAAAVVVSAGVPRSVMLACVLAGAAAWELTPRKRRLVRACHLLAPVAPAGRRADVGCVLAGLRYGRLCVGACWPIMLAMAVAGHEQIALMAVLTVLVVVEMGALRPSRLAPAASALLLYASVVTLAAAG